jgi:hypothetical protein
MTSLLKTFSLPAAVLALALGTGVASAQPVGQTPLASPIQQTGSVTPSVSSSCGGLISDRPIQILQVSG